MTSLADDPSWLRERYVDDRLSFTAIAELADVSRATVWRRLEAAGIDRRPKFKTEPTFPQLRDAALLFDALVVRGLTFEALADEVGASLTTVRKAVYQADAQLREAGWVPNEVYAGPIRVRRAGGRADDRVRFGPAAA